MRIINDLLTINPYSRPGRPLYSVMGIVIHYLGAPGQPAMAARNYWESLKNQDAEDAKQDVYASAHFVVDFDGIVLRTIPETEMAYHCGAKKYTQKACDAFGNYCDSNSSPNRVTIGVELTHPAADGKPGDITRDVAVELIRDLCKRFGLEPRKQVFRHYDITGKDCPRWFVANPEDWNAFLVSI